MVVITKVDTYFFSSVYTCVHPSNYMSIYILPFIIYPSVRRMHILYAYSISLYVATESPRPALSAEVVSMANSCSERRCL